MQGMAPTRPTRNSAVSAESIDGLLFFRTRIRMPTRSRGINELFGEKLSSPKECAMAAGRHREPPPDGFPVRRGPPRPRPEAVERLGRWEGGAGAPPPASAQLACSGPRVPARAGAFGARAVRSPGHCAELRRSSRCLEALAAQQGQGVLLACRHGRCADLPLYRLPSAACQPSAGGGEQAMGKGHKSSKAQCLHLQSRPTAPPSACLCLPTGCQRRAVSKHFSVISALSQR